jgi:hypothetical protein
MTRMTILRRLAGAIAAASTVACAEATRDRSTSPQPSYDAYLQVPDPLPAEGARLVVMIRITGSRANELGSFTGRIAYDTAGLTFVAETPLADGATRLSNPQPGEIRTAAIRAQGFGDAPVAAYEFIVKSRSAIATMSLKVEELHDIKLGDATANVRLLPLNKVTR